MQAETSKGLRTALYARVSTEEQREGQTIESQIDELKRFADQKGWRTTGVYKDDGWSGGLIARPELDRLRDDASEGLFDVVLINDVDRLARDVAHLGVIKRDLLRHGVEVVFKKLPTENSPTHNLMVNILGSFAEFERELIADRTRRGRRYKVEVRKQFLGTLAPYGYKYVPKNHVAGKEGYLAFVPEEAAIVRQMYHWVDQEGLSARQVVARLNEREIRPRKGGAQWAKSTVCRILRSEVYAGVWYYNKFEGCEPANPVKTQRYRKSAKTSTRLRPRTEWLPVIFPGHLRIIEHDLWRRVQGQLDRNIAFSTRNSKHSYFLRGMVICGGCGARFVGEPGHGKFYYRCHRRCKKCPTIKADHLDSTVWNALKEVVLNPDLIAGQVEKIQKEMAAGARGMPEESRELQKALKHLDKEEVRLLEAYRMSIISPHQLSRELEALKIRRETLENQKAFAAEHNDVRSSLLIHRSIKDFCGMVAKRLASFTDFQRQRFMQLIVRAVIFDGKRIKIKGAIPIGDGRRTKGLALGFNPGDSGSGMPSDQSNLTSSAIGIASMATGSHGRNSRPEFRGYTNDGQDNSEANFVYFQLERPILKAGEGKSNR